MDKFEQLKQAVESYIIAEATCSRLDAQEAYRFMLETAGLENYL